MKTGIELIAHERSEQIERHGRTVERDVDENIHDQLLSAAMSLMLGSDNCPVYWNRTVWKRMISKPKKERLIIAGALIAAEIDRLQYIEKLT